jgi:CheY-like chemotaxis protein
MDFQRLKQIILNLISNAIKFTNENGYIYITYTILLDKNEFIFEIKDTGIGISEEKKHLLFQMFSRVHDGMYQGTGLGLVISKNIAELMGGTLNYSSIIGKGTTFKVCLPFKNLLLTEEDSINRERLNSIGLKDMNILVVEDNLINMKIVIKMLEKIEIKNHSQAFNGLDALELIKNSNFDIILMDIHMPKLNGLETTKKIREFNINVPIIAMTASTFDNEIKDCFENGMTDKLLKPFTLKELKTILMRWNTYKN